MFSSFLKHFREDKEKICPPPSWVQVSFTYFCSHNLSCRICDCIHFLHCKYTSFCSASFLHRHYFFTSFLVYSMFSLPVIPCIKPTFPPFFWHNNFLQNFLVCVCVHDITYSFCSAFSSCFILPLVVTFPLFCGRVLSHHIFQWKTNKSWSTCFVFSLWCLASKFLFLFKKFWLFLGL